MDRRLLYMLSLALAVVLSLAPSAGGLHAQPCSGGVFRDNINPTIGWQTYPCVKGGEYLEFTGVAGKFYTFTFCMAGGYNSVDTQISILDGSGADAGGFNDDACLLGSHVGYWWCPANGTYRVLVTEYNCMASPVCNTLAYKMEPDPGGPGITCGSPYNITLPFQASGFSTCGFGFDYSSANACSSIYMDDEDFVFQFSGTAGQCINIFTDNTFTYTGLFLVRGCPNSGGALCVASDEASAGNPYLSNVTLPTTATYYIIVDGDGTAFPDCTPFDIEVFNCVGVGQGSTCATAFTIPSLPYSQNGFTTCGKGNAYTSAHACGSPYMNGEDFVFRYVASGPQCISIDITNSFTYSAVFVYDGCPNAGGTNCLAFRGDPSGDPEIRSVNLPSAGTYYIMVSTWPAPNCTPFNISVYNCVNPCPSNPNANNTCSSATPVSLAVGDTVCGIANYFFTADASPSLTSAFCGSIENNSWFAIVADSAQMTIRIDVPDCMSGFGLQVQAFSTSNCNSFTSVSTCWNPQFQTNGFITMSGLTVGQTYYIMIDGYAGDDCTYLLYRIGTGPMPVEWSYIEANPHGEHVTVDWATLSEVNVLGFHVQRGYQTGEGQEGLRWKDIGYIASPGNTATGRQYSLDDTPPYAGTTWYYRIRQVDVDGMSSFSDVVEVNLDGGSTSKMQAVYPVPAQSEVHFRFYAARNGTAKLAVFDVTGKQVGEKSMDIIQPETQEISFGTASLANGSYFFMLTIGTEVLKGRFEVQN